jgi:hypothetical protein
MSNLPYNWNVISNDGSNIVAWNRATEQTFEDTLANFNALLLSAVVDSSPEWSSATQYFTNDIVLRNDAYYIALQPSVNQDPTGAPSYWNNLSNLLTAISDLTDVNTTGVTNGQALVFDSTDSTWKPGDAASGTTFTNAGDITNLTVTPTPGTDQVIAARITTGDGLLTINVPETGVAFVQVLLTSDANGTKEIGITAGAVTIQWTDRTAVQLNPKTGETIGLGIRCFNGAVILSVEYAGAPV